MHARQFTRERHRIERQAGGKQRHADAALRHLVRRTGAIAVIANHRIVGYRMRDGSVACMKQRYRTFIDAQQDLTRIQRIARHTHVPVHVYRCQWCAGFHLTSRAA